jgi:hypothetical protein
MYNKTILGSYPGPVNGVGHKARTVFYTPTRGAFLSIVRLNAFGLADLLNIPNDPRMSAEKKAKAKVLVDAFYQKWYDKFGGNRTALANVIANGAKERAFGFNIPLVKNLGFVKDLKAAGAIGNVPNNQVGIGVAGETFIAVCEAAWPVLVALGTILTVLVSIFKKPDGTLPGTGSGTDGTGDNRIIDNSGNTPPPPPTEDTAGYGLIGAAVLAALYFGTQSKTPTRRRRTVKK